MKKKMLFKDCRWPRPCNRRQIAPTAGPEAMPLSNLYMQYVLFDGSQRTNGQFSKQSLKTERCYYKKKAFF